jgi:hypothetical protein
MAGRPFSTLREVASKRTSALAALSHARTSVMFADDFRAGVSAAISCGSSKPSGFAFHPRRREATPVMRNVIP